MRFLPLVLLLACSTVPTRPGYEVLPDMVDSVAYDAFAPNPITADGKTLMRPAEGTIPRGFAPFHYGATPVEAERAGRELANPLLPTPESLKRGELMFGRFCSPCHGKTGLGDGLLIPRFPAPPALTAQHARSLPDGRLFHVMTLGQGLMPSHATQVPAIDRWRIVHFIRSLQGAKP